MKKIQLATMSLAVLALAGCTQEDNWFGGQDAAYTGVVEGNGNGATRSYNGGNGAFKWNAGDDISVWTGSSFTTMKMIKGEDTDVAGYASISGTPQEVAVFPVTAATSYSGGALTVNYPAVHEWDVDTKAVNDPLVAYVNTGDRQFNFMHVGGVIEWDVKMPAGINKFVAKMPSAVTGDFTVTKSETGIPSVATTATTGTNNEVTFTFPTTTADTEMHFYMPVPTGTYDGIQIWIYEPNGDPNDMKDATAPLTINRCDWVKVPVTMGGYTGVIESSVSTSADLVAKALQGGAVLLSEDIDAQQTVAVPAGKTFSLNLNSSTLSNTEDLWDTSDDSWSLASVRGGNLTITGNGTMKAKENDCYAVDVQDGGHLVIENGHFVGNIHAVYVQQGIAEIKGGTYEVQQKYPQADKADEFVLNCYDANRANGTAKIIVTGGRFINFNPADCWAEGEHTNFVADGYTSVLVNTNPVTYEVVKNTAEATTSTNLLSALSAKTGTGSDVINVSGNITVDNYMYFSSETKTMNLNNATLAAASDRLRALKVSTNGTLNISGTGTLAAPSNYPTYNPIWCAALDTEKAKTINISGNLTFKGGSNCAAGLVSAAIVINGGTVNIASGYFSSELSVSGAPNPVIYMCYNAKKAGVCNIYGGVFESVNPQYLLNIQDDSRSYCKFNIYGGTFVGFNPATDNTADGIGVAAGYKSVQTTYKGKTAWKVVKE